MNKNTTILTILFIIVLIFSFFVLSQGKNKNQSQSKTSKPTAQQTQIILFYGQGCPHCAKVEEYIKENKVKEKIAFEEKEVYYNQNNAKELGEKAKSCGIDQNEIGVPFLWDSGKCLIGDQDIINFFKEKMKVT